MREPLQLLERVRDLLLDFERSFELLAGAVQTLRSASPRLVSNVTTCDRMTPHIPSRGASWCCC
jgi:hypothetical protein